MHPHHVIISAEFTYYTLCFSLLFAGYIITIVYTNYKLYYKNTQITTSNILPKASAPLRLRSVYFGGPS